MKQKEWYPQYSMYLYIMTAIPIAMAANKTDVMSIIQMHKVNPMNERILKEEKKNIFYKGIDEFVVHKKKLYPNFSIAE